MKKILALLAGVIVSTAVISDYKSTFLINGWEYSTLSWLAPDYSSEKWTLETLNKLVNNGDTHADVYARSTDRNFGHFDGVDRTYWRSRLNRLLDSGISPVIWLTSDDRNFSDNTVKKQIEYNNEVVDAVDDLVSHYVVCLECDESFSAKAVGNMIDALREKGVNKPIGVHLTPHMYKSKNTARLKEYYEKADVIYLQTGWAKEIGEKEFRKRIEYALTFGKPVVVSEYDREGTTSTARTFGDIACSYEGVVGTGNGRGNTICRSLVVPEEKKTEWERIKEFGKKNEFELILFTVMLLAAYDKFGFNEDLPFVIKFNYANDNGHELMMLKPVTETIDAGIIHNSNGRTIIFGSKRF